MADSRPQVPPILINTSPTFQKEITMYNDILNFWFNELTPQQWWAKDEQLDADIKQRFSAIHAQAARCELFDWRIAAKGRLAEIIILDQFSRNIFRDTPQAFV